MLKRPAILFAGLLLAAALVLGVARLFELRLGQGDIYPPYSSLRTDPLGASVLYESLERVPGQTARRWFDATLKEDEGRGHTLLVLGARPWATRWLGRSEFEVLQRHLFNGGRVVIAYAPEIRETWSSRRARTNDTDDASSPWSSDEKKPARRTFKKATAAPSPIVSTNSSGATNTVPTTNDPALLKLKRLDEILPALKPREETKSRDLRKREAQQEREEQQDELRRSARLDEEWGFDFAYASLGTNDDGRVIFADAQRAGADAALPAQLTVHTALHFTSLTNGWTTIYQRDPKKPVVIERRFGAGSVVLVADAYPFSNEALFQERRAPLLTWLLGGGRDTLFEEAHLGVVSTDGVASLLRKYRLHGLLGSLLAVAGLFVWKNSRSLVPPHADEAAAGAVVLGKASAAGFVNLLRRGIPAPDILAACVAEWKKSGARHAAVPPARRVEVAALLEQQAARPPRERQPVQTFRTITELLKRR
jgi:hypothetical protein